ncbi:MULTISPECIES: hypothetical protein [Vibrio]|uniref:hypothetical protein n=1 Tax=Vibrio TaxID=662 RepID=UPI0004DF42BB|nr:hypothetical protein [Vibrio parahaemolyticus]EGQ9239450.1 hypothetical protein [Vibrio vulnificus]EHD1698090.1 hypothetical protein [Vibrio vulnificus]EKZ9225820.1 hypothetical protein [Vibrio vulnificus]ELC9582661.1 hypothetical protein [Vibrio vulnificus]MCU8149801.1 hypothetical protein [Vibrio vulnificus]
MSTNDQCIVIDLDDAFFAPSVELSLLDLLIENNVQWYPSATVVTQESDGALQFWGCSVESIEKALSMNSKDNGLLQYLGWSNLVATTYAYVDEHEVVASDWRTALVTKEAYLNARGRHQHG